MEPETKDAIEMPRKESGLDPKTLNLTLLPISDSKILQKKSSSSAKAMFSSAIKRVKTDKREAKKDVDHAVAVLYKSLNHITEMFELHTTNSGGDDVDASANNLFAPQSVDHSHVRVPPPLAMSQVIKLMVCKEKIQHLLDEHSFHHGSAVLHPKATTATLAQSVASNNAIYDKIKASGRTTKQRRRKRSSTTRSTVGLPVGGNNSGGNNSGDNNIQPTTVAKDPKNPSAGAFSLRQESTCENYTFSNDEMCDSSIESDYDDIEEDVVCCCCFHSSPITDVTRAAVLLDDAMRLRSPYHDMDSALQIKVWEFLGTFTWKKTTQTVAIIYSFFLAAYTKPFTNTTQGTHFNTRHSQFTMEGACLLFICLDLFLCLYSYGMFAISEHKFFVGASVITFLSVVDWTVAVALFYGNNEQVYFRFIACLHCFYLPYYVPRIRSYMQMTIGAAMALKNVLLLLILWMMVSFVAVVYMSPKACQYPELKLCAPQDPALLYQDTIVECGEKMDALGDDGVCGTKLYHNRTGALFAQSEVYANDARQVLMNLLFLMIGSVNYPDVSLPGISTMSKAMYAPWLVFLFMGVVYILNLVLAVVYIEFTKNYGKSYQERWTKFRETLFRAMILVDVDGTGELEFDEFSALFHALNKLAFHKKIRNEKNGGKPFAQVLVSAFKKIDADQTGSINKGEFLEICNSLLGDTVTPKWIHPSRWDISTNTLKELKRRVRESIGDMKQYRKSLTTSTTSSKRSTTKTNIGSSKMDTNIRAMELRGSHLEQHSQRRRSILFDDWYTKTSKIDRFIHGGLFPNLRQYLLNPFFLFGKNWMTLLVVASAFLCVANAWWGMYCSTIEDYKLWQPFILTLEWLGIGVFISEMIFKILAVGLSGYWHTGWWRFDGIITMLSLILMSVEYHTRQEFECKDRMADLKHFRWLLTWRILQFMRAFRITRIWARTSGLRNLADIVFQFTTGPFIHWIGLIVTVMIPFAHFACALWGNHMHWTDKNSALYKSSYMSSGDFKFTSNVGYNGTTTIHSPYARVVNFDDFTQSILSLSMIAFQNNWHVIYDGTFKSFSVKIGETETDQERIFRMFGETASTIFFVLYLILAVLVVLNLLVSHFLQMYQTVTDEHNERKQKALKIINDMQAGAGAVSETRSNNNKSNKKNENKNCLAKSYIYLRRLFCSQNCQLTGIEVGPDDYVWMIAPQLGCGYEPIAVDIAVSLEIVQPDKNSALSRFIQKEWVKHRPSNAIDRIRKEAEILLGVEKAHRAASQTGHTQEISKMFKEASKIEQKWLKGHQKSMSHMRISSMKNLFQQQQEK